MALSNDLTTAFAKLLDTKQVDMGTTMKGTFKVINGKEYVQVDGSEILTPVITTVEAVQDERVQVLIKDHIATITANITSPAARNKSVQDLKDEVDEQGNTIQQMDNTIIQQNNSIIQMENTINQQGNTINQHGNLINQQGDTIVSLENTIVQQGNTISQMNNTIIQQGDNINSMNNTIIQHGNSINSMNNIIVEHGNTITQQGNTITQQGNQITQINNTVVEQGNKILLLDNRVDIQGSDIMILNSGFNIVDGQLTGLSEIIIESLITENLNAVYADIDFANINMAAVEKLFADSGIIKDLIVEEGHITGELVGVTIKGDLIEGNTIKADKLVVMGEDGIYYKLNISGETVETEQTDENSLSGSIITAKSITASKISVTDLVAFGATIAGFIISEAAIYSGAKSGINSDIKGIYLDKEGQFYLGDASDHVKYYKDQNGNYILDIRAEQIYLGASITPLGNTISEITLKTNAIELLVETNTDDILNHTNTIAQLEIADGEIRQSVGMVNENLNNNYLTTSQTNDLVNSASAGLMNTFSKAGGNNLFKNSSLLYGEHPTYDHWIGNLTQVSYDDAITGKAIRIGSGPVIQTISNVGHGDFSIRFKFKKVGSGIDTQFNFTINDTEFDILTDEGVIELSYYNTAGSTDFVLMTNQPDQFIIYDLMLNYGKDIFLPYQQAMNELKTTNVSISENIKIESNVSNTITTLGTEGLIGRNKTTNIIVFKQTESGLYTTFLQADEAEIGDLMIKKVGLQMWLTGK